MKEDADVEVFLEWAREEGILEMYRNVLLGAISPVTASAHGHRFHRLSESGYMAVLLYYNPEMSSTEMVQILKNSQIRSSLFT